MPIINPTDLTDLYAWYRVDVGVTVGTGGVSDWDNSEGTANRDLIQSVSGQRPAFISAGTAGGPPSGLPSIQFVRNIVLLDDRLDTTSELFAPGGVYTVAMAVKLPPSSSNIETLVRQRLNGLSTDGVFSKLANDTLAFSHFDYTNSVIASTGFTLDTWVVILYAVTAIDTVIIRIDGVVQAVGTSTGLSNWTQGARIGANSAVESANCRFGELAVYNRVLLGAEITDIETYLTNRWLTRKDSIIGNGIGAGIIGEN